MTAIALTIAGSDSGGGAGIQADLKTFAALGVYGASAVTAITAQNTQGVSALHDVPPGIVAAQIDAVFADFAVGAVKIGMLSRRTTIEVVADALARHAARNVVLDPVMVASTGARLLAEDAVEALIALLVPRALVVTPNLPEAARLAGAAPACSEPEMEAQARTILARGARNVLIKGGHGTGAESVDLLVARDRVLRLAAPRIATTHTHGSGCTFSSALAARLAQGRDLAAAAREAKDYVTAAIAAADRLQVGHGRGPLHHFHAHDRADRRRPDAAQPDQAAGAEAARGHPDATRRNA
ncbi:MAG: bifunctional hydroxymethylpyrimidine kinase/phosphomethylpyrimidine kinase [Pseudolabrys sp.]|nr:bifunctional hydroxymethylpyrimidine kinase/phosphomethylpyrimidine kinase [Pseudolabrys sp.]